MNGLVIGIPRQLLTVRSGASELADRMNEESRAENRRTDEARQATMRELEVLHAEVKRYGRHSAAQAPPRLHTPSRSFGGGVPAIRPSAPSTSAPAASTRSNSAGGRFIDTVAVYRFRNSGVRPTVAPAKAAAPRTFGALASNVYHAGDAPSFLIGSSARGGAA